MTFAISLVCPLRGAAVQSAGWLPVVLDLRSREELDAVERARSTLVGLYGAAAVESLAAEASVRRTSVTLTEALSVPPPRAAGPSLVMVDRDAIARLIAARSIAIDGRVWNVHVDETQIAALLSGQNISALAHTAQDASPIMLVPVPEAAKVYADAAVVDEVLIDTDRLSSFLANPVVPGRQGRPFVLQMSAQAVADLVAYGSAEVATPGSGTITLLSAPDASTLVRNGSVRIQYLWRVPDVAIEQERLLRQAFGSTLKSLTPSAATALDVHVPTIAACLEFVVGISAVGAAAAGISGERLRAQVADRLNVVQQDLGLCRSNDPSAPFVARGLSLDVGSVGDGAGVEAATKFVCDIVSSLAGGAADDRRWTQQRDGSVTLAMRDNPGVAVSVLARRSETRLCAIVQLSDAEVGARAEPIAPLAGSRLIEYHDPASDERAGLPTREDNREQDQATGGDHTDLTARGWTRPIARPDAVAAPVIEVPAPAETPDDGRSNLARADAPRAEQLAAIDRIITRSFPTLRTSWRTNRLLRLSDREFAVVLIAGAICGGASALRKLSGLDIADDDGGAG